jgi:hypothetical protein
VGKNSATGTLRVASSRKPSRVSCGRELAAGGGGCRRAAASRPSVREAALAVGGSATFAGRADSGRVQERRQSLIPPKSWRLIALFLVSSRIFSAVRLSSCPSDAHRLSNDTWKQRFLKKLVSWYANHPGSAPVKFFAAVRSRALIRRCHGRSRCCFLPLRRPARDQWQN